MSGWKPQSGELVVVRADIETVKRTRCSPDGPIHFAYEMDSERTTYFPSLDATCVLRTARGVCTTEWIEGHTYPTDKQGEEQEDKASKQ